MYLQLADRDNTLGICKTIPILVSFNNVTLKHQFQVINLEEGVDCYIGDDLINLFNITVSNIPCHWPGQKLESTKENHNIGNPPEANNSPAGTPEDHQEFMHAIRPYTEKIKRFLRHPFALFDISIIRLDTLPCLLIVPIFTNTPLHLRYSLWLMKHLPPHLFKIHPGDQHKTTFAQRGRQYMFQDPPNSLFQP